MAVTRRKYNNPELETGSDWANFVVESLSSDPTPTQAGRLFFHSTEKEIKFTGLDGGGGVIVDTLHSKIDFDAHVTAMAATTADASGLSLIGYDGATGSNALYSQSATNMATAMDSAVQAIDTDRKAKADRETAEAATTGGSSGATLVGYDGHTGTNTQFSVASGNVANSFDLLVQGIDTVKQDIADLGTGSLTDMQTEMDAIETALGAMIAADGSFSTTALDGGNYMDAATDSTGALLALDTQIKTNTDGLAAEITARGNADALKLDLVGGTMSGAIGMGINKITNLGTPTADADAATKLYVDNRVAGITAKYSVAMASTSVIANLSSVNVSQDGVTAVEGDRILVKDTASPNGVIAVGDIYNGLYEFGVVNGGLAPLTRVADFDGAPDNEVSPGSYCYVSSGTLNSGNGYAVNSVGSLDGGMHNVGIDGITFVQVNGLGQVVAGSGLSKNGNEIYVNMGAGIVMLPNDEVGVDVRATGGLITTLDGTSSSTDAGAELAVLLDTTDATHGQTISTSSTGLRVHQDVITLINTNESGLASEITNRGTAVSGVQSELDATQTALGAMVAANGTYVAHSGKNYINSNTDVTADIIDLDTAIGANLSDANYVLAANKVQANLTALDTAIGANLSDGNYVLAASKVQANLTLLDTAIGANLSDGTYVLAASKVQSNLTLLDIGLAAEVTNRGTAVSGVQSELDATQTAVGYVNANGTYASWTGSNYMDSATTGKLAITALDTAIGANLSNANYVLAANKVQANLTALDTAIGANLSNGNYVLAASKVQANLTLLDTAIGANLSDANYVLAANKVQANLTALDTAIGANVSNGNRILATNKVQANITALDTELGAAVSDGTVILATNKINQNVTALDTGLASEITNRGTAVSGVQSELDATQTAVGYVNANGTYASWTGSNYMDSATTGKLAITALDTAIGANLSDGNYVLAASKVQGNLTALDTAIGANLSNGNYVLAANKVQANLTALDTAIGANLSNGTYVLAASKVQANLTLLDTGLANEVTNRGTAVSGEATARATADTAIRTDINAQKFTYESPAALTSHTINHGLNTTMPSITLWVEDAGEWVNHAVLTKITDANNISVSGLSSAAKIRAIVQNGADIAS